MQSAKLNVLPELLNVAQMPLNTRFNGIWLADHFTRLQEVVTHLGEIKADFVIWCNTDKIPILQGKASAIVTQGCQRCSADLEYNLDCDFCLQILKNPKNEDFDSICMDKYGNIDLITVIEDELLLSLPQILLHETEFCSSKVQTFGKIDEITTNKNPFQELANYYKKGN